MKHHTNTGFTLVELMIVVGILGVLTMIAIPSYKNYIQTSCMSTAGMNLQTLRNFLENYNIENGTYLAGTHTAGMTTADSPLMAPLRWDPDDNNEFNYAVVAGTTGSIATSYKVTVSGAGGCADIEAIVDGK